MTPSQAFGFVFDSTVVADQEAQCKAVEDEFLKQIAFGTVDVETKLTEFNEKLYAAGLQDIIDAKQEQLDAWLANQ